MSIPRNGRVVVIDDDPSEGLPLMRALTREGIPVSYFTGNPEELPIEPLSGVRFVFLDIVLTPGQPDKTKLSTLKRVLEKAIDIGGNGPYCVVAWTKHEWLIKELKGLLVQNPPVVILNLEKSECKGANGEFDMDSIETKLKEELEKADVFRIFVIWDELVHRSSGEVVKDFSSFYPNDQDWCKRMQVVLRELAIANGGEQLDRGNSNELIRNALLAFDSAFLDVLENNIKASDYVGVDVKGWSAMSMDSVVKARINSKLLLVPEENNIVQPGNIYEASGQEREVVEQLLDRSLDKYVDKDEFLARARHVFLEVSPYCDYSQKKWRGCRLLRGVMFPAEYKDRVSKLAEYVCKTPELEIENGRYILVFDLRRIESISPEKLSLKLRFRIRHALLVEIQSRLARQISRPGFLYL